MTHKTINRPPHRGCTLARLSLPPLILLRLQELTLVRALLEEGQAHIFEAWPAPGGSGARCLRLLAWL